jgi:branched-chain amino acid transport system substrate-binding protein
VRSRFAAGHVTLRSTGLASALISALLAWTTPAHAQFSDDVIRIGLITDLSGVLADIDGPAGAEMVRQAVADMGGSVAGKKIEVLVADHQNKPDIAATKAREWFDTRGLDMLIGGTNSGVDAAMAKVALEKKKPFLAVGSGSSALTNDQCSPYTIHYAFDTVALAKGIGTALVHAGDKTWYFLTSDYSGGVQFQTDTTKVVLAAGGTVVGSVRHPLGASDFSSFLLQAQQSKAQVLALANAGGDTINAIKAANEFGINKTMKLAALLLFINDVHSLGLQATQGMYLVDSWYWNLSPESRAWSNRFFEKFQRMPSSLQAADYSATQFYLNAVKEANTDDGEKVMEQMRKSKIHDMYAKSGYVRPDGRMVHDMYLLRVKSPAASQSPWDYYDVISTTKGEDAFTSKADSTCALWK